MEATFPESAEGNPSLNARRVTVTLLIDTQPYTLNERTVVGGADRPDEVDRTVILAGERYDVDEGDRITVTGTLRVVLHGASAVNGVFVPGWTEIRVEEEYGRPQEMAEQPSVVRRADTEA